jgi:hypothetical protein
MMEYKKVCLFLNWAWSQTFTMTLITHFHTYTKDIVSSMFALIFASFIFDSKIKGGKSQWRVLILFLLARDTHGDSYPVMTAGVSPSFRK